MARTTLFELDRMPVPERRRRRRGKVVDDGRPLDLRYSWAAYPEPRVAHAAGTGGWTAALQDELGDDPTTAESVDVAVQVAVPPEPTITSPHLTAPTAPGDGPPVTNDHEPAASTPPRASLVVATPSDESSTVAPRPGTIPSTAGPGRVEEPAGPSIPPTAPTTEHDDRFMQAITEAARGGAPEAEPPASDEADQPTPPPASAAMTHSIFDRLGSRLAQATSYDAGSFEARRVFDRLDSELDGGTTPGERPPSGSLDVVEDLAAILGTAPGDLRTRLGREDDTTPERDSWASQGSQSVATSRTAIEKLQAYLGVTEADFSASEDEYFAGLKEHLVRAGTITRTDTVDRSTFGDAVAEFQKSRGLTQDGIPGEDTLWELQRDWAAARNLDVREVPADVWLRPPLTESQYVPDDHGYRTFRLRQDAADLYDALRTDVQAAGAQITSSGSLRNMSATVTAGRSNTSMHYSGIALDLATVTGMRDAAVDPYLITAEGDRWRVWARTESGEERSLDAVVWSAGTTRTQTVEAKVIDFTALAEAHGFARIPHRSSFPGSYLSAEWWHFQANQLLTPWISQFGIELLSLARYSESDLRAASGIWDRRKAIFKRRPAAKGWH